MFTVIWRHMALESLADLVVQANLEMQDTIERQVVALNRRLADDPLDTGESRTGGFRIAFADPIGILFHVDESNQVVIVVSCWAY